MGNDIANIFETDKSLTRQEFRSGVLDLEEAIKKNEGVLIGNNDTAPLKHTFADGMYIREIFIPKGFVVTGKIHKHKHPSFLLKGSVLVVTEENGKEVLTAPLSMVSASGTKRALFSLTDLVWVTVHNNPTNTRDIEELEREIAVDTFEQYDVYVKKQGKLPQKIKDFISKIL